MIGRVIAISHGGIRGAVELGRSLGKRSLVVDLDTLERLLDAEAECERLRAALRAIDAVPVSPLPPGVSVPVTDVHGQKWMIGPGYAEPLE